MFRLCPELLGGFFTKSEQHYLESLCSRVGESVRHFLPDDPRSKQFEQICADPAANAPFNRCRMLFLAISVFFEAPKSPPPEAPHSGSATERFEQLMENMPAAEIEGRDLRELAVMCRCSVRHLSRLFRSYFGYSVRARQIETRLQKARLLLQEPDVKISSVALESGFQHLGLFSAMFKKRFGMTPTEMRRSISSQACSTPLRGRAADASELERNLYESHGSAKSSL